MLMNKDFDIAYLRQYVNGELSSSEMYAIEKASHEDEQLMDIILGLEEEKNLNQPIEISDIHSAIYERTHTKKVRSIKIFKPLSIAASLVLLLGIGAIWYLNRDHNKMDQTMETVAIEPSDAPTDTTLNTIEIDSLVRQSDEENLIAMATPENTDDQREQSIINNKKRIEARTGSKPTIEEITANKQDIFFREVPNADTNAFQNRSYDRIAGIQASPLSKNDNSAVILLGEKRLAANSNKVMIRGISSLQDVKKVATGRVLDQKSGRPIVNASVRDIKTNDVVMTDSSGQYVMPLTSENQNLEVLSLGYEKANIIASNNKVVQLKPDFNTLEEVVVVGYDEKSPKIKSEPLVGWIAYKKYINDNSYQTLLGKGNVTLVFDISSFGRPIDIIVKKTSNPDLNQKAIQIIQNGPDWKKGNDGKKIEVKISFK